MIRWMLERLEADPYAVFYESELLRRFSSKEFASVREAGLLRRVGLGATFASGLVRARLLVDAPGRGYEAYDDDHPDEDFVPIPQADLARWTLDLSAVARRFMEANSLDGLPGPLDQRLYFLGATSRKPNTAVVLGLLGGPDAFRLLQALPAMLPPGGERTAVVCPSFLPEPVQARALGEQGIEVMRLGDELFSLPLFPDETERLDPDTLVAAMTEVLQNLPTRVRVGAGQALNHIVDHQKIVDLHAAARIINELPITFDSSRVHTLLYEGRSRFKVKGCVFCPDRMRSDGIG